MFRLITASLNTRIRGCYGWGWGRCCREMICWRRHTQFGLTHQVTRQSTSDVQLVSESDRLGSAQRPALHTRAPLQSALVLQAWASHASNTAMPQITPNNLFFTLISLNPCRTQFTRLGWCKAPPPFASIQMMAQRAACITQTTQVYESMRQRSSTHSSFTTNCPSRPVQVECPTITVTIHRSIDRRLNPGY